jgi:hypothetical protein
VSHFHQSFLNVILKLKIDWAKVGKEIETIIG